MYLVSFHMEACKQAKQSVRIHIHKRSHIVVGTQESKVSTIAKCINLVQYHSIQASMQALGFGF